MSYLGTKGKLARILQRFDRFCRCFKGNDSKFIREANTRKEYRRGCKEIRERPSFNQSWKRSFRRRALRLARFFLSDRIEICANPRDDSISRFRECISVGEDLLANESNVSSGIREKH